MSTGWVNIDLNGKILAHVHSVGETMIDWVKLLQHHQKIGEENHHLVGRVVENLQNKVNVLLEFLNEAIECLITDHIY